MKSEPGLAKSDTRVENDETYYPEEIGDIFNRKLGIQLRDQFNHVADCHV